MMRAGSIIAAALLFLISGPALAAHGHVEWSSVSKRMAIADHVDYLAEPREGMTIEEIRRVPDDQWTANESENISLGYGETAYWFRLEIRHTSSAPAPVFLEISYPVLDYLDAYILEGGELKNFYAMGDKLPFYQRPVYHRNFVVPTELQPDQPRTIYLRVETTSSMQVPMTLWSPDAFYISEQSRTLFEGIYYGIVLVMILYNLFVYFAVGERSFLYYVGYIAAMPLFIASLHGVSFQYLWPQATWWNDQSIIVFLNLVVVFGAVFSMRFINVTYRNHPVLNPVTWVVVGISGVLALGGLLFEYRYLILPTIITAAAGCIGMLVLSFVRWAKGDPAARYYALAWVFMLFGGLVLALSKFTVLPRNLLTENATQVGSALGVILLSIALADRLNKEKVRAFKAQQRLLREERKARQAQEKTLSIQQEANTMLEQRVQERTRDLEALNEQLLVLNSTDALTGLKNRGHFDRAFQTASVKAYRFSEPLSILVLDIDHFKAFNDTYGHLVGDDCLQMVAQSIKLYVTRPQDLAARYGGEEFVVLLPNTPEDGAIRVAENIRKEIAGTSFRVADEILHLTISVGVYTATPDQADDTTEIFRRADEALYEAKGQGRNRVIAYRSETGDALSTSN